MIKNIIFDIGNVLFDFKWNEYIHDLFDDETADKVTAALWGTGYWKELDRGVLTNEQILELFYSEGPDVIDEINEAFNRVEECIVRRDWVVPKIRELKDAGYKVYFLSNLSYHIREKGRHAMDFLDYMDGGIFSCDVKVIKPGAAIFGKMLDKYDLVPEECIFIDDHQDNISMAKKFGIKGIRFDSREQMDRDLEQALIKDRGHDRITVLCYGDSNTYGYDPVTWARYPYEDRWPTILGDMLGDRYEVIAEGLNGRTTAYDRPGAGWKNGVQSFVACLGTHKPVDILIIMLGTNDCIEPLGLTAEQITKGMDNLIRLTYAEMPGIQGYIPEIIITAPAAIRKEIADSPLAFEFSGDSVARSERLGELYGDLAESHMIKFADATRAAEVAEDCVHLSVRGHRQLAELMYNVIKADPDNYEIEEPLHP